MNIDKTYAVQHVTNFLNENAENDKLFPIYQRLACQGELFTSTEEIAEFMIDRLSGSSGGVEEFEQEAIFSLTLDDYYSLGNLSQPQTDAIDEVLSDVEVHSGVFTLDDLRTLRDTIVFETSPNVGINDPMPESDNALMENHLDGLIDESRLSTAVENANALFAGLSDLDGDAVVQSH